MATEATTGAKEVPSWVVRFNIAQRVEHWLVMISFIALMVTGLPQHFFEAGWASWLIIHFGGIDMTRLIHRFFAVIFTLEAVYHVAYTVYVVLGKRGRPSMIPNLTDARDAITTIRYSFGLSEKRPAYDRFSYRQKFEYWGVVFGTVIMIVTGFVLAYPLFITQFLPGEIIPAAKEMHGWEALLALSIIVIWHLYGTHLAPGHFPLDKVIFTGKIEKEDLKEEHGKEYARLFGADIGHEPKAEAGGKPADTTAEGPPS